MAGAVTLCVPDILRANSMPVSLASVTLASWQADAFQKIERGFTLASNVVDRGPRLMPTPIDPVMPPVAPMPPSSLNSDSFAPAAAPAPVAAVPAADAPPKAFVAPAPDLRAPITRNSAAASAVAAPAPVAEARVPTPPVAAVAAASVKVLKPAAPATFHMLTPSYVSKQPLVAAIIPKPDMTAKVDLAANTDAVATIRLVAKTETIERKPEPVERKPDPIVVQIPEAARQASASAAPVTPGQASAGPVLASVNPVLASAGPVLASAGEVDIKLIIPDAIRPVPVPLPPEPAKKAEAPRALTPAEHLGLAGKERVRAEKCLSQAIYFEARNEPVRGQVAVAQVVLNRVFSPYYPKDVCSVVYQNAHRLLSCQFTFACDGHPETIRERGAWSRAQRIAKQALDHKVWLPEVAKATHYHAVYVHPYWVREMKKMVRHGRHIFYRPWKWRDGADEPGWKLVELGQGQRQTGRFDKAEEGHLIAGPAIAGLSTFSTAIFNVAWTPGRAATP